MGAVLWALEAVLLGFGLVYRFAGLRGLRPRWAGWALIFACGVSVGIGITSALFFLARPFTPAVVPVIIEIALAAWVVFEVRRALPGAVEPQRDRPPESRWWLAMLAAALAIVFAADTLAISAGWSALPDGYWDAWSMWNLRARFLLAGGEIAHRAWFPEAIGHPEYPALVPAFIARCWYLSRSVDASAPMATSYLFFLAMLAFGAGGTAALRGSRLGIIFAVLLAGTPAVVREVPMQYADIPLACYFAGALVMMLVERPVMAGVLAAMAAWTKDEGGVFLLVFLVVVASLRRTEIRRTLVGASPGVALLMFYKLALARGTSSLLGQSLPGLLPRLTDGHRYATVVTALGAQFQGMMLGGWYHPLWPAIVLAIGLGVARDRRHTIFATAITASMCFVYFFVYIGTANDLAWHLGTSLYRLTVHVWPCILLTVFTGLRPWESAVAIPSITPEPPAVAKDSGKRRNR